MNEIIKVIVSFLLGVAATMTLTIFFTLFIAYEFVFLVSVLLFSCLFFANIIYENLFKED